VYVVVVSTQICSKAETQRAFPLWTGISLSVHGVEVFTAKVRLLSGRPSGRWHALVGALARKSLGAVVVLTGNLVHPCFGPKGSAQ
jgi:hypothetical protein